ncbi:hypothetical protein niasHT_009334 [Heterodera trifolii]|uniref:Effector protein n=1 Tax=Heterodera trifolii TaxID=157864 RepID=A0ABD2LZ78_9BILA
MFSTHFSSSAVSLLFLFVYSTVCLPYSTATILPAFSDFLSTAYGDKIEESIARRDLGSSGSFGHQNVIVYAKVADYHCPRVQIVTAKEQLELINDNYNQFIE